MINICLECEHCIDCRGNKKKVPDPEIGWTIAWKRTGFYCKLFPNKEIIDFITGGVGEKRYEQEGCRDCVFHEYRSCYVINWNGNCDRFEKRKDEKKEIQINGLMGELEKEADDSISVGKRCRVRNKIVRFKEKLARPELYTEVDYKKIETNYKDFMSLSFDQALSLLGLF